MGAFEWISLAAKAVVAIAPDVIALFQAKRVELKGGTPPTWKDRQAATDAVLAAREAAAKAKKTP